MLRRQNVILFSAGESVASGKVDYVKQRLKENGIACLDWRDLFKNAHDSSQIALLPSLLKKIPTFDFALIFAESVDEMKLRGQAGFKTMRDNVVFELGLSVMALGTKRVILLADEGIRIPDDLTGIGKIGVKHIIYKADNTGNTPDLGKLLDAPAAEVVSHIKNNSEIVSPVFIGAAVSSAEAYFMNFLVRLLENSDKPFFLRGDENRKFRFPADFSVEIIFPRSLDRPTAENVKRCYAERNAEAYIIKIKNAGTRALQFSGVWNNSFTVLDIPTSITASHTLVNSILNIASDDEYDLTAEERFITKELDTYESALKQLCSREIAEKRLDFIKDETKKAFVLDKLQRVIFTHTDFEDMR